MTEKRVAETSKSYLLLVDQYASYFDRPELRLRFLSRTLARQTARQEEWHRRFRRLSFIEQSRLYRWLLDLQLFRTILVEFKLLLPNAAHERRRIWHEAPWNARLFYYLYQVRHLVYFVAAAFVAASLLGLAVLIRQATSFSGETARNAVTQSVAPGTALAAPSVAFLPTYRPEKVWMVEESSEYERYSNGARILTAHETSNHPRAYYLFSRNPAEAPDSEIQRQPIGIVYHSSESDTVPFTADNSDSIQSIATGLRDYVRRHRSYNYLIDRFGEIHRIVRDDDAANHAGHSLWADDRHVYVGLNESFIGICFESTSTTGTLDEQLTEAQLVSGRALTSILRSRYQISDANCTTHGLVSVDPNRLTIAHHHDWVRNFPFAAFSLSDKYSVSPASVSLYGFGTDAEILAKLGGKPWPGVQSAELEFRQRLGPAGQGLDEMRRRQVDLYRAQMEKEWALRQQPLGGVAGGGER